MMNKAKITFSSEIRKHIKIIDQWIADGKMVIQYNYQGQEHTLEADECKTMDLLEKIGIIEAQRCMMVMMRDEHGYPVWIDWCDFNYKLSQYDALMIVSGEIEDESMRQWVKEIASIPSLIKGMEV